MGVPFQHRLSSLFNLRRDEVPAVVLGAVFFFFVLTALMVVRPARDALGMTRGIESVRWLFVATALVTLLANPVFGWLVSRFTRMRFIAATYLFFAASLAAFYMVLIFAPAAVGEVSGQVFYVWFSVFNLFATMLFWALMADRFSLEQSKRFFPLIAVGGTLGAIFGPWLASGLARPFGTASLLLVSAGFLMAALGAAWGVGRGQHGTGNPRNRPDVDRHAVAACGQGAVATEAGHASGPGQCLGGSSGDDKAVIGGSAWQGLKAVWRSPYLLGIVGYVVIMSVMATFLYFTRLQMVAELGEDIDLRTAWFARIDFITQLATLVLQMLLAGRLMNRLGVPLTLTLLPVTMVLGFAGLAVMGGLATLIVFEAAFRAVQRALTRPARETLYTVVGREDKYKSKAFIDTFGLRAGDVAGAQVEGVLGRLGVGLLGLAGVAIALAVLWAALGIWLGRAQQRMAAGDVPPSPDEGTTPTSFSSNRSRP